MIQNNSTCILYEIIFIQDNTKRVNKRLANQTSLLGIATGNVNSEETGVLVYFRAYHSSKLGIGVVADRTVLSCRTVQLVYNHVKRDIGHKNECTVLCHLLSCHTLVVRIHIHNSDAYAGRGGIHRLNQEVRICKEQCRTKHHCYQNYPPTLYCK